MGEYIKKSDIKYSKQRIEAWFGCQPDNYYALVAFKTQIDDIPAADVRPVVLCKDCIMYECHEYDGGLKYVCRLFKRQMQETDFCSYGKKRDES